MPTIVVVGGGLAGSECALTLARRGYDVTLYEMRPQEMSPAHTSGNFAELVCSNSFKTDRPDSAAGQLKRELTLLGSSLLPLIYETRVPAGGALAVDRDEFSELVTKTIEAEPRITVIREEVCEIPEADIVIIAAGPLCSEKLSASIQELIGQDYLSFYDAAAPIVEAESLDFDILFAESRYGKGGSADYLNAPFTKEEYEKFYTELIGAQKAILKDFERKELFQACQPVEEVARTGVDALRFGALKPVGLTDPRTGKRPYAVVQLRAENKEHTAYNLVGFQTNLTFGEQKRVFSLIPGLEHAEFARYGVMHRNTFINSPQVLDATFALPKARQTGKAGERTVRFAGQITGTEGYTEAIASGLLAALQTICELEGLPPVKLPDNSMFGALVAYATNPETKPYQPMHVNLGIVPFEHEGRLKKKERHEKKAAAAQAALEAYVQSRPELFIPQEEQ